MNLERLQQKHVGASFMNLNIPWYLQPSAAVLIDELRCESPMIVPHEVPNRAGRGTETLFQYSGPIVAGLVKIAHLHATASLKRADAAHSFIKALGFADAEAMTAPIYTAHQALTKPDVQDIADAVCRHVGHPSIDGAKPVIKNMMNFYAVEMAIFKGVSA